MASGPPSPDYDGGPGRNNGMKTVTTRPAAARLVATARADRFRVLLALSRARDAGGRRDGMTNMPPGGRSGPDRGHSITRNRIDADRSGRPALPPPRTGTGGRPDDARPAVPGRVRGLRCGRPAGVHPPGGDTTFQDRHGPSTAPCPVRSARRDQSSCIIPRAKPTSAPPAGRGRAQIRPPIALTRRAHTNRPMPAPAVVTAVLGER